MHPTREERPLGIHTVAKNVALRTMNRNISLSPNNYYNHKNKPTTPKSKPSSYRYADRIRSQQLLIWTIRENSPACLSGILSYFGIVKQRGLEFNEACLKGFPQRKRLPLEA